MMRKVVVEQLRIRNIDAQAVWYAVSSSMYDADEVPTRVLIDDEIVWESQP